MKFKQSSSVFILLGGMVFYRTLLNDKPVLRELRRSQVIMVQICWATHALQGLKQLDATIKIEANLQK